jgi:hypothetical protein
MPQPRAHQNIEIYWLLVILEEKCLDLNLSSTPSNIDDLSFLCGLQTKNVKMKQVVLIDTISWFEGFGNLAHMEGYKLISREPRMKNQTQVKWRHIALTVQELST